MKISTKGRYGLRILLDVALNQSRGSVALNDIAKRQNISGKYLWQVVNPLKAVGLVRVTRGAKGGYTLARPPAQITLFDIMLPLEGAFTLVDCVHAETACPRAEACVARQVWSELSDSIADSFRHITLADLIKRVKAMNDRHGTDNYVI